MVQIDRRNERLFAELKQLQVGHKVKLNEGLTRGGISVQHSVTGNLTCRHYTCKTSNKQWKRYTCALEGTVLYCFPDEGQVAGKSWQKAKHIFPVLMVTAALNLDCEDPVKNRIDADPLTLTDFGVVCANNLVCFRCEKSEDTEVWIRKLNEGLSDVLKKNYQTKKTQLDMLEKLMYRDIQKEHDELNGLAAELALSGRSALCSPLVSEDKVIEGSLMVARVNDIEASRTRKWKERYAVITDNNLYIYHNKIQELPSLILDLTAIVSVYFDKKDLSNGKWAWQLRFVSRSVWFRAPHVTASSAWIDAIVTASGGEVGVELAEALEHYATSAPSSEQLVQMLSNPRSAGSVRTFLRSKKCLSFVSFLRDFETLAELSIADGAGDRVLDDKVKKMIERYIKPKGSHHIGLLTHMLSDSLASLQSRDWTGCFANAKHVIVEHMENELLPQFLDSSAYTDMQLKLTHPEARAEALLGRKFLLVETETSGASKRVVKQTIKLQPTCTLIGRDAACDVVLEDTYASRSHCRIQVNDQDQCLLFDLGSARGTLVNGVRVTQCGLRLGDVVSIGHTILRLSDCMPNW